MFKAMKISHPLLICTLIKNGWALESWLGGSEHLLLKYLGLIPSNQKEGHRLLGARHVCGAQMCHSYTLSNKNKSNDH